MTRDQKIYQYTYWLASFILAIVFLLSYEHLLYPAEFARVVYRFDLLPSFLVNGVSLFIPWLEMVAAGAILFVPKYRVSALWLVGILVAIFTMGISVNIIRDSAFGCGCFGAFSPDAPVSWQSVMRNLGLMALVFMALVAEKRTKKS